MDADGHGARGVVHDAAQGWRRDGAGRRGEGEHQVLELRHDVAASAGQKLGPTLRELSVRATRCRP